LFREGLGFRRYCLEKGWDWRILFREGLGFKRYCSEKGWDSDNIV